MEEQKQCPECGKPMVKRSGSKGEFWGCTGYPACRHTAPLEGNSVAQPINNGGPKLDNVMVMLNSINNKVDILLKRTDEEGEKPAEGTEDIPF